MNKRPARMTVIRNQQLRLESLEARWMLDGDPVAWGTDARLTLSFAPDGTHVADEASNLFQQMSRIGIGSSVFDNSVLSRPAAWQSAILRAFQTWAENTNGDIGVVPDDGSDFGVTGLTRHDARFGDIRIGSIPLDNELYAVAIPASEIADGTWVGDVLFNSNHHFRSVDELFAVALHEAGHVFGLSHSSDPHSPMYTHGIPGPDARTPTTEDILALQSLYGPRSEDVYDVLNEPGPVEVPAFRFENDPLGSAPSVVFADLTTAADVDEYQIEIPSTYTYPNASITVELVASGISSLMATLTVLPEVGTNPIATATTSWNTDASIDVLSVSAGDKFRVQVQSAPGDFRIGGYTLMVTYNQTNQVNTSSIADLVTYPIRQLHLEELRDYFTNGLQLFVHEDGGTDDLEGNEHELQTAPGFDENTHYWIEASIETVGDIDRYAIQTPQSMPTSGDWARLSFRSLDGADFSGELRVFDAERDLLPVDYLVRNDYLTILQFGPTLFDSEYFVEVLAADGSALSIGNYRLEASFGTQHIERALFLDGSLSNSHAIDRYRLSVHRPQLFQFALDATDNASIDAELVLTIRDQAGSVLLLLSTPIGDLRTSAVFLPSGSFHITVRAESSVGPTGPVFYKLLGSTIDNPLGPRVDDPTTTPFSFDINHRLLLASIVFGI